MSKKAIVPEGADDIGFIDPVEQLPSIHTRSGRVRKEAYEAEMERLQEQLVLLQYWIQQQGLKVVVIFEGRGSAGKGGVIKRITERTSPRTVKVAALPTPTERQKTQWYFQRYIEHLPAAGELVLFDRSWYNRAGVERVMGFCSDAQYRRFLLDCPLFEKLLVDDGIVLLKYWLAVDQEFQEARFAERASDPLKRFKISPIDLKAREQYAAYGAARDAMFAATNTKWAPWYVANFNDQRRGRLDVVRHLLQLLPERAAPDKPLKLAKLKTRPGREKLADERLWIASDG